MKNNAKTLDLSNLETFFSDIIEQIKAGKEDPCELKELYKIFKKNVPFSLRSYFMGYLVKNVAIRSSKRRFAHDSGKERFSRERKFEESPRKSQELRSPLDPEHVKSIFISTGREYRFNTKDALGLLTQGAGVDRDHIGSIKIHGRYSFVDVLDSEAEEIIQKINGIKHRGKTLTVSYAIDKSQVTDFYDDAEESATVAQEEVASSEQ